MQIDIYTIRLTGCQQDALHNTCVTLGLSTAKMWATTQKLCGGTHPVVTLMED